MKFNLTKLACIFSKTEPTASKYYERDFHTLTLDQLCDRLNSSTEMGLDPNRAQQLLIKNGKNKISQKGKNPIFKIIGYFFSGFCPLIWFAAIVCFLCWKPLGNPPDPTNLGLGILLIFVISIQAAFTAFQDWSSNKVMKSIKNMLPTEALVIRNGVEKKIPAEELVIGDLVLLSYGTKVPADIRLTVVQDIKFDKSVLTGESEAVEGTDERYVESENTA